MLIYVRRLTHAASIGNHVNRDFCLLIIFSGWLLPNITDGHDWPMWRYDPGRSAASPGELSEQMYLQWVRKLATPRPAWPESQDRLRFDASYEPILRLGYTIKVRDESDPIIVERSGESVACVGTIRGGGEELRGIAERLLGCQAGS